MFAPAITTVFVLGVFWKRGTKQAALATFIIGVVAGLAYFIVDLPHNVAVDEVQAAIDAGRVSPNNIVDGIVYNYERIAQGAGIPFMMMGLVLFAACIIVYVGTSLMTPAPTAEELEKMGWQPPLKAITQKKISGIGDPRIAAVVLFGLMIILYCILR